MTESRLEKQSGFAFWRDDMVLKTVFYKIIM
jgi:hypothetical protein